MVRHHFPSSPPVAPVPDASWRLGASGVREQDGACLTAGEWFARPEPRQMLRSLPDVLTVRIEVNGCLVGAAECLAEASREFAVGWTFIHRFYSAPDQIGTVSGSSARVAMMVDSGEDLDRRKLEAAGWTTWDEDDGDRSEASSRLPRTVPFVSQHDVIALSERAFARFDVDGRTSGLACAALAQGDELDVIARDIAPRGALAKILGWIMMNQSDGPGSILIVCGLIDERMVDAISRAGIGVIVTDGEPTAAAARRASSLGITVIGLVMSHRRAFFADGGHVGDDLE